MKVGSKVLIKNGSYKGAIAEVIEVLDYCSIDVEFSNGKIGHYDIDDVELLREMKL